MRLTRFITKKCVLCFCLLFYFAITTHIAKAESSPPWQKWKSTQNISHPLVGQIYATAEEKFISANELISRLAYQDYTLLGETHDNSDHHILQAWVIENIVVYDRKPVLVFEMIDENQDEILKTYLQGVKKRIQKRPAQNFGPAVKWTERGWPEWRIYQPIARIAFRYKLPITHGSPTRENVKSVLKKGLSHLTDATKEKLKLKARLVAPLPKSVKDELSKAHCHLLPNSALAPMATAQRYKDSSLAERLVTAGEKKGSILISGSGHIRRDRGVPFYIKKHKKNARIGSLEIAEVDGKKMHIKDYIVRDRRGNPVVDFIWLTPRHERPDPCEHLKKHLNKK
ncbi:MAG: ChaN family lipoprotein [Pseudomonadota bacterium]